MARPRDFVEGEVLDRAMVVFWRHGYEGASMAELTKAMGLNSPSIYIAFGSKRGLFDAVLNRYSERRAANREYVLAGATAREVAERMLFNAIGWLVDPQEPRGCLLIQAGLSTGVNNEDVPLALFKHRSRAKEWLTERLVRAQLEGDLPQSEDPVALARYLSMVFSGLALQAAEGMPEAELRESAERALIGWPLRPGGTVSSCYDRLDTFSSKSIPSGIRGDASRDPSTVRMYEFAEIGSAVRTRRSDIGLTQARVANLCGLSPATVEQLENGSIGELDWAQAVRLLSVLGLSARISNPHSTRRQREEGEPALEVAARSASTSYREVLSAEDLRVALLTATYPKNFSPHVRTFLDEAHVSQIADVVEQLHHETGISRGELWQHMRNMARTVHTIRDIWL